MAVKIRLKRMGAKKGPFYRIVVADARFPRDGRFIEELGYYDPLGNPAKISVDEAKVRQWMGQGARMTETVRSLLKKSGVLQRLGANVAEERG
jgi:small subunit ribosomal protein S16